MGFFEGLSKAWHGNPHTKKLLLAKQMRGFTTPGRHNKRLQRHINLLEDRTYNTPEVHAQKLTEVPGRLFRKLVASLYDQKKSRALEKVRTSKPGHA
jgi:hypothetical protein